MAIRRYLCTSYRRSTLYKASKKYDIPPYVTLYSHHKGPRGKKQSKKGLPTTIPRLHEEKLAEGLRTLEKWGFGLSRKEVLETVGTFVKTNKLETIFKNGIPGGGFVPGI